MRKAWLILAALLLLAPLQASPQTDNPGHAGAHASLLEGMTYRSIGPYRGGRSAAVAGVPGKPTTFYFGATGGGVWVTEDGGSNWKNISDGYFGGSIGAVAVSEWDNNVIYVGGGEKTVRGNVSHGYGMWKTTDRGKTWKQIGLTDTRHIPRIRIHPKNPDVVYVAAMGHLSGPNEERGIYKTTDGGETWEKIKFVSNEVGAVDLAMDPTNPRVLYASFWRVKRTPYSLESGGEGSSIWKTTDGGKTWDQIDDNPGLPGGTIGISGLSVSPVNPDRVWAIIEAEKGGLFVSDNGGETWRKTNEERSLRQRAWYYTRVYADTHDIDTVYVLNVRFWKSKDGGKSFSSIRTPHGDHHDLWIDPQEPQRMVIADDGGAQVTFDGGAAWSTYHNQPTAQFYRVTTDNHFPYRIYGAQQDNSTVRIAHRTRGGSITEDDWEATAGGESGHIAPHPENPDIVYGGSYGGFLTRVDHDRGDVRLVNVWPDNPMGHGAADLKYRFQWNFPIFFSPHDPGTLYAAGNVLFKTTNEGQTWEPISPDLTRDEKSMQGPSGGPITKDNTSVEYYCTIFAAMESPHEQGVIWAGSDDGLLHITRDGGANWENVTPTGMPEWTMINSIEIDPFNKGGLYVAGTRYKLDDFQPYLYKTEDYGKTWKTIVNGIDPLHFTRVIRADPKRQGLLYAGTETGMYVSFDDGASWESFQLNLPIVPITDLALKDDDLIVATQGRSFWVMDDLTPLHQFSEVGDKAFHLYKPRDSWRLSGFGGFGRGGAVGDNLPGGVLIHFYVKDDPSGKPAKAMPAKADTDNDKKKKKKRRKKKDEPKTDAAQAKADTKPEAPKKPPVVEITILDADGQEIRSFSSKDRRSRLSVKQGVNRFVWNMRYPDAESFPGMVVWSGGMTGPMALPGTYKVRMTVGEETQEHDFVIKAVPNGTATEADLQAQFDFLMDVNEKLTETHQAITKIRAARKQIDTATKPMVGKDEHKAVMEMAKDIKKALTEVEEALYQTKNRSRQDPLNFPIRLNDKLAGLNRAAMGDHRPTDASIAVKKELTAAIDAELAKMKDVFDSKIPELNTLIKEAALPAIYFKDDSED